MSRDKRMREIAEKFRRDMEKLDLGVTISVPGRAPVVVTPPPKCRTCGEPITLENRRRGKKCVVCSQ